MLHYLTGKQKNLKRKEVKKMKRLCILSMAVLFLFGGLNVLAADPEPPIVNTSSHSTIHVQYFYNTFGVATMSVSDTATAIITTRRETLEDGSIIETTTTTTTNQTTISTWRGGSLKVDSTTGTTTVESSDGASSTTSFWTTYDYNENGQLRGASGGSHTVGDRGLDDNDEPIGTYEQWTSNTYEIRNGQALLAGSTTTGKEWGPDGELIAETTETKSYSYELRGGSWVLMSVSSVYDSTGKGSKKGEYTHIETTTSYHRDANGLCTGISQSKSGEMRQGNGSGGFTTYKMKNYIATAAFDPKQGWYIEYDTWDWIDISGSGGGTDDPTPSEAWADLWEAWTTQQKAEYLRDLIDLYVPDVGSENYARMLEIFQSLEYDEQLVILSELSQPYYPTAATAILSNLDAATRNQLFVDIAKQNPAAAARLIAHWPTGVDAEEIYKMFAGLLGSDGDVAKAVLAALDADPVRSYFANVLIRQHFALISQQSGPVNIINTEEATK